MWWLKICRVYVTTIDSSIFWWSLIVLISIFCACLRLGEVNVKKFLKHLGATRFKNLFYPLGQRAAQSTHTCNWLYKIHVQGNTDNAHKSRCIFAPSLLPCAYRWRIGLKRIISNNCSLSTRFEHVAFHDIPLPDSLNFTKTRACADLLAVILVV